MSRITARPRLRQPPRRHVAAHRLLPRRSCLALLTGLAAAAAGGWARAQDAAGQRIAAVVNQEIILLRELENRVALAILASGLEDTPDMRRRLAAQVLRGLIDERLQLQAAARARITVPDAEIERAYDDVARRNELSRDQLGQLLASREIDPSAVREQIRAQLSWVRLVSRDLRAKVVVTNDQLELAAKAGVPGEDELLLSEIVLPVYEGQDERQVVADGTELRNSLRDGADFAALARQLSSSPSAESGGDLGWVRLAAITPELRGVLARLPIGGVSEPVRTPLGVQILKVRERRTAQAVDAVDREALRRRLQDDQLQRLAARSLRDLRRDAFIDVRL